MWHKEVLQDPEKESQRYYWIMKKLHTKNGPKSRDQVLESYRPIKPLAFKVLKGTHNVTYSGAVGSENHDQPTN